MRHLQSIFLILILFTGSFTQAVTYAKHWFGHGPYSESQNSLEVVLAYDIYIVAFDLNKKLPRWTAYHLSPSITLGSIESKRNYKPDPYLKKGTFLGKKHYEGAHGFGYDRGHLAPLGSFKNSPHITQTNYFTNLTPQKSNLNRGPWVRLESTVREFVKKGNEVKVFVGLLYGDKNYGKPFLKPNKLLWPSVNGYISELPTGFWKVVSHLNSSNNIVEVCSFLMHQEAQRGDDFRKYIVDQHTLRSYTALALITGVSYKEYCGFLAQ